MSAVDVLNEIVTKQDMEIADLRRQLAEAQYAAIEIAKSRAEIKTERDAANVLLRKAQEVLGSSAELPYSLDPALHAAITAHLEPK